jgi:hypothetical protein
VWRVERISISLSKGCWCGTLPFEGDGVSGARVCQVGSGEALNWSDFLLALTLTQPGVSTLPVLLNKFQSAVEGRLYGPQAAIGTVITLPVLILGVLIHKHLIKGFSFGMMRK